MQIENRHTYQQRNHDSTELLRWQSRRVENADRLRFASSGQCWCLRILAFLLLLLRFQAAGQTSYPGQRRQFLVTSLCPRSPSLTRPREETSTCRSCSWQERPLFWLRCCLHEEDRRVRIPLWHVTNAWATMKRSRKPFNRSSLTS